MCLISVYILGLFQGEEAKVARFARIVQAVKLRIQCHAIVASGALDLVLEGPDSIQLAVRDVRTGPG